MQMGWEPGKPQHYNQNAKPQTRDGKLNRNVFFIINSNTKTKSLWTRRLGWRYRCCSYKFIFKISHTQSLYNYGEHNSLSVVLMGSMKMAYLGVLWKYALFKSKNNFGILFYLQSLTSHLSKCRNGSPEETTLKAVPFGTCSASLQPDTLNYLTLLRWLKQ